VSKRPSRFGVSAAAQDGGSIPGMIDSSREREKPAIGSERSFSLVFAIVFGIIAGWPLASGGAPRLWAFAVAVVFLILGYAMPAVLRPLNVAWFRLGLLMGAVMTPVVMAVLYLTTFLPTNLILRFTGRDLLGLKREPDRSTYWVMREKLGPGQRTMKRQF
jgi:Saxitoxin biosynthesis operon protein SxtJ